MNSRFERNQWQTFLLKITKTGLFSKTVQSEINTFIQQLKTYSFSRYKTRPEGADRWKHPMEQTIVSCCKI